jgi:hypothetical protein
VNRDGLGHDPEQAAAERRWCGVGTCERILLPLSPLGEEATMDPEFPAGNGESHLRLGIPVGLVQSIKRGAQVAVLVFKPVELGGSQVLEEHAVVALRAVEEVLGVSAAHMRQHTPLSKPLLSELGDRRQHRETLSGPPYEALVDEGSQGVQVGVAHHLGSLERPSADEDRKLRKQPLLLRREHVVAPGNGSFQRPLPLRRVARTPGENRERPLEAREDLIRAQHLDPRRRELERER